MMALVKLIDNYDYLIAVYMVSNMAGCRYSGC